MGRGRAAAAADQVDQPVAREPGQDAGRLVGRLVVAAQLVGEARVRVGGDAHVRDAPQLRDERPERRRAERAVEADAPRPGVADGVPERLGGLPGERPPGQVDDGSGQEHRQPQPGGFEDLLEREDRGLGVERVEDRLDQEQVRAALDEAARRVRVGRPELLEADVAGRRVGDVRGDRGGPVRRSQRAGDPARPAVARLGRVRGGAGQPGGGRVHLARQVGQPVVGLADRRGVEGVRLDHVGAGVEVGGVDRRDHVGPGERKQVVVAAQVTRMIARSASLGSRPP